eukprot:4052865-Pleurochrysis_carterae.AAC.1
MEPKLRLRPASSVSALQSIIVIYEYLTNAAVEGAPHYATAPATQRQTQNGRSDPLLLVSTACVRREHGRA